MNIIEPNWFWNGKLSTRSSTEYIVLHHAEASSCTAFQVDDWHKSNGWLGIGYHFFVRKNGEIYRGRPLWAQGSHVLGKNNCSIGICAEGSYMKEKMPDIQKKAIAELIDYIKKNHYPNAKIVGHKEIGSSNCPGINYPLEELKNYKDLLKEDEQPMTQEERIKFNELVNLVSNIAEKVDEVYNPMIWDYVDDNMPEWARPTISKLCDRGSLQGDENGRLGLDIHMLRIFVALDRIGLLDK